MKCDNCEYKQGYTLGRDECGAGNYEEYCAKGHWEGRGEGAGDVEGNNKKVVDYWSNCKDFKQKLNP